MAIALSAFGWSCSDVAQRAPDPVPLPQSGGGPGGSGGAALGAASGANTLGGAGGGDQLAGAGGAASGSAGGGRGGAGGALQCSECSGTPLCDETSWTCKTCTAFSGCSSELPLCDTTANGGLGQCKQAEVVAIYTDYLTNMDLAHRSYVYEANDWFPKMAAMHGFSYETTPDWERIKTVAPARGRVLVFLDDKPKELTQQAAFQRYMEAGGAWLGCHFAAYTPTPIVWDWYFNLFLGSGDYAGNTWRPTSAELAVEDATHPLSAGLGAKFKAAPNEWYAFKVDLRTKPNMKVLLSIHPSSFPLGTGPKPEEIWQSGYYPVVWTNTDYRMLYVNMGHNDMDYGGTNQAISSTFSSPTQNQMLLNAVRWLSVATKSP
jgi:hypothetical protein